MTNVVSTNNNRKLILTTAGVMAVGVGAYGLGRVYPPLGSEPGTVAPSQRYVSSQVSDADVTLGDTSVAELMQTDAFQVLVKDPNFRKLANDPGFAALRITGQRWRRSLAIPANSRPWRVIRRPSIIWCSRPRRCPRHRRRTPRPIRPRSA